MPDFTEAITFAQSHEVPWPRDPQADPARWGVHHEDPPPYNRLRGPVHARGGVSGVIRLHGEEVARWGEPDRADQTFSVAKTYLALLAGVAQARGLLDAQQRVGEAVPGIGFDDPHNREIRWAHLLDQTSEWQGSCFGMPDQVEHNRRVSHDPKPPQGRKGEARTLQQPGTYWEYNDVRINQFALALLHLFRRPLPEVFTQSILQPLGGGEGFLWEGYDDAWASIDGVRMQSVTGGTHWGGGVKISARDQARIGQLMLDGGAHGPTAVARALDRAHAAAVGGRAVLWLAHLAEPGRADVRGCTAQQLFPGGRRGPLHLGRSGARDGGGRPLAGSGALSRLRSAGSRRPGFPAQAYSRVTNCSIQ